jgi:metal-responsive CopG/Arc/MetJ family transcriptional regulator
MRGRKKIWPERREMALPAGTLDRIAAVLRDGEDRSDFVRLAIERELARREGEEIESKSSRA